MNIKYLGTDDSVNTCDCCGKSGLKHTVGLDINGTVQFYGVVCAGRALGKKTRSADDVSAAVSQVNELERIKCRVDDMRSDGRDFVYGRFYIGNTIKTHKTIAEISDKLCHQIYPER